MKLQELCELIGADPPVPAGAEPELRRVSSLETASPDSVVFAVDALSLGRALQSHAGLILSPSTLLLTQSASGDGRVVRVSDPKYAFALCGRALAARFDGEAIHPSAMINATAELGAGTQVGAGAVVEAGVAMGADCRIGSRVTVCAGVVLGDRVVVQPGAVLGSAGFGYVRNAATGEYIQFPQQGELVIEDDVEIGANTTIDRGALGETRIGRGTKIDNQVHIGHNCKVGRNVVIAAQVGVSGSCVIEDDVVIAGQVGLGDHVTIGRGVILGGAAGVFPHKRLEGSGQMFMGVPAEPLKSYLRTLARMRRLR